MTPGTGPLGRRNPCAGGTSSVPAHSSLGSLPIESEKQPSLRVGLTIGIFENSSGWRSRFVAAVYQSRKIRKLPPTVNEDPLGSALISRHLPTRRPCRPQTRLQWSSSPIPPSNPYPRPHERLSAASSTCRAYQTHQDHLPITGTDTAAYGVIAHRASLAGEHQFHPR